MIVLSTNANIIALLRWLAEAAEEPHFSKVALLEVEQSLDQQRILLTYASFPFDSHYFLFDARLQKLWTERRFGVYLRSDR